MYVCRVSVYTIQISVGNLFETSFSSIISYGDVSDSHCKRIITNVIKKCSTAGETYYQ